MNHISQIALITLIVITGTASFLLVIGKVKLVLVRRPKEEREDRNDSFIVLPCVTTTESRTGKQGRPRKDGSTKVTTRNLFLPPGINQDTLNNVSDLFSKHRTKSGNKVVLYIPNAGKAEQKVVLPFYVQWNSNLEQGLSQVLGGWA